MNKKTIKLLAASVILANSIVLLPGCHKVIGFDESNNLVKYSVQDELNGLNINNSDYRKLKKIEKIYVKINEESVVVNQVLAQTDSSHYTFYTTGKDVMVIVEGDTLVAWFSSNITPSDAYSAIASYNTQQSIFKRDDFYYLNPSSFYYLINSENDGISYSDSGKLEIDLDTNVRRITICEVTPSKVKDLNESQTEEYILKQDSSYNIPDYVMNTLRYSQELPLIFMKNNDILSVTYDGNYFETYIGFAEKDFNSIPFFGFSFNDFIKNENVFYKA